MGLFLGACGSTGGTQTDSVTPEASETSAPEPEMPSSASDFEGDDYKDVVEALETAGFTNIETKALGDLITGWLIEDGSVDSVEVDGQSDFGAGSTFPSDVKIVVAHHSFPEDEEEAEEEGEAEEEILTVENSEDLAALLAGPESGESVAAFSDEYRTKVIQFDGHVAAIGPGDFEDEISILILAGEYDAPTGPNFQITEEISEIGEPDSVVPGNLKVKQNIRITAVVGMYEDDSGLFYLLLESIEIR